MRNLFRLIGLAVLLYALPRAHAADLSGTWKGTFGFNGQDVPTTLHLTTAGAAITGTVEGLPTSPVDIHDGKLEGDALSFWVNTDYEGEAYKLLFKGKVKEDTIDFAFGTDDGSWGTTMSVKRDAGAAAPVPAAVPAMADATGTWKGDWDMMGTSVTSTIVLKVSGAAVTGTVQSGSQTMEIHDGKIEGDTVTFWVNSEYQGQTYVVQYKGKISAGQINFDFGLADGSWGSTVIAKKS